VNGRCSICVIRNRQADQPTGSKGTIRERQSMRHHLRASAISFCTTHLRATLERFIRVVDGTMSVPQWTILPAQRTRWDRFAHPEKLPALMLASRSVTLWCVTGETGGCRRRDRASGFTGSRFSHHRSWWRWSAVSRPAAASDDTRRTASRLSLSEVSGRLPGISTTTTQRMLRRAAYFRYLPGVGCYPSNFLTLHQPNSSPQGDGAQDAFHLASLMGSIAGARLCGR